MLTRLISGLLFLSLGGSISPSSLFAAPLPDIRLSHNTLRQGQTLKVQLLTKRALKSSTIKLSRNTYRIFYKGRSKKTHRYIYYAHVGISRKLPPKRYSLRVHLRYQNGSQYRTRYKFWVTNGQFKKEHIKLSKKKQSLATNYTSLRSENITLSKVLKKRTFRRYFTFPFINPVSKGRITSPFGRMRIYNGIPSWSHSGVDFGKHLNANILASNHGKVAYTGKLTVHGNTIIVDHGWGIMTIYQHLNRILVKPGQRVRKGTVIGKMGSTGIATGPHLHWGFIVQSVRVDPLYWTHRKRKFLY